MDERNTTAYRLEKAIQEKGYSYVELERLSGVPKSAIQRYAKGVTARIPVDRLMKIAQALGISAWDIIGSDFVYQPGPYGLYLNDAMESYQDVQKSEGSVKDLPSALIRVPVLGTIPAGVPIEAIEDILDWEEVPADWGRGGKEYFALKISGDSMTPNYLDGDVLIFRRQDDCESGDDCAIMVNGNDATFKRVRKSEKGVTLTPLNPAYEPMVFSNQEVVDVPVRIIGVVVELRRTI